MKITEFEECNTTFAKDQPEYLPLPAYLKPGKESEVVSCWELTDEEIEKLKKTKRIYLSLWTFGNALQPQYMTINKEEVIP